MIPNPPFDVTGNGYKQTRMAQWDQIAVKWRPWSGMDGWCHNSLAETSKLLASPNLRIREIDCGIAGPIAGFESSHEVRKVEFRFSRESHPQMIERPGFLGRENVDGFALPGLLGRLFPPDIRSFHIA